MASRRLPLNDPAFRRQWEQPLSWFRGGLVPEAAGDAGPRDVVYPGGLLSGGGGAAATTGDVGAALDAFAADLSDFVDDLVKDVGRAAKIDDSRNL